MEVCANKNPLQSILCGGALGTHRFQWAAQAGGALGNNGPSSRDCTLEAMRTQGAPPDSCAIERGWRDGSGSSRLNKKKIGVNPPLSASSAFYLPTHRCENRSSDVEIPPIWYPQASNRRVGKI